MKYHLITSRSKHTAAAYYELLSTEELPAVAGATQNIVESVTILTASDYTLNQTSSFIVLKDYRKLNILKSVFLTISFFMTVLTIHSVSHRFYSIVHLGKDPSLIWDKQLQIIYLEM